jgi:catechol 2,3-dioxygenase-like lactoylglutathione lyase family enzyme
MLIDRIDHVVLPVPDLAVAAAPFERLGLKLTASSRHRGQGTENRAFFVGDRRAQFYVELLAVHDEAEARAAGRGDYVDAMRSGPALSRVVFGTVHLSAVRLALQAGGIEAAPYLVRNDNGEKVCEVLPFGPGADAAGIPASAIQYEGDLEARFARRKANGLLDHGFPLKRLDHLAAFAPELGVIEPFWSDVLGVPVHGEVRGRAMRIRQLKIGDAILELLAPDSEESPLRQRPPGLASMCAFEVDNLDSAVSHARERGFTPSEPAPGVLPGTRVATIPGAELSGLAIQLLAYD